MTGELKIKTVTIEGREALECQVSLGKIKMIDKMMILDAVMQALEFNGLDRAIGSAVLGCGGFAEFMHSLGAKGGSTTIDLSAMSDLLKD